MSMKKKGLAMTLKRTVNMHMMMKVTTTMMIIIIPRTTMTTNHMKDINMKKRSTMFMPMMKTRKSLLYW